jgi:ABC-type glycerol-3-phosphate transport system substrate-binding protein
METSNSTIDFALRNAVIPLNDFIDKDKANGEDVLSWFPEEAMIPVTLYDCSQNAQREETYYGLPDSLTFSMLFYRKDILAQLGYDNPTEQLKTWDDLLAMIPVLQYNNMEVGIQNDIYTFIYQSGADAYSNNGMTINFDDPVVLNAFTTLCNMYTQYSLSYQFDFANRFRTGEMPIGIASYTACNQLAIFASELSGLWEFVPLPGYELVDEKTGETYINNCAMAGVTGAIMLTGSDNQQNAWEVMKWYTSAEFQVPYSNDIVSIKGIAA